MIYNKNQKRFLLAGSLWSIYDGFTTFFLTAFALIFGASNEQIGLIAAIPYLSVILTELPGAKLLEFISRKWISFFSIIFSRSFWVFIILIPFLFNKNPVLFIIIFYLLIKIVELVSEPAWISLMADITPEKIRGRYFGFRNMLINSFGSLAALIGGFYLDFYPKESFVGFLSLFFAGTLFGISTAIPVKNIKEPEFQDHHHHSLREFFSLKGELKVLCYSMFCFNFATMIASPFFTVYMLKNLEMSYRFFVIASIISTITKIIAQPHIGKISDRYGDKPVAIISTMATAFIPLIYFFITKEAIWLIIPAQILSGLAWAGVDISAFNLMLDKSNEKRRGLDIAEYTTFTSIPMVIGPIIGGFIADNVKLIFTGIPLLFLIAFFLRFIASLTLFHIKETRVKKEYPIMVVFKHFIALHPLKEIEYSFKIIRKRHWL